MGNWLGGRLMTKILNFSRFCEFCLLAEYGPTFICRYVCHRRDISTFSIIWWPLWPRLGTVWAGKLAQSLWPRSRLFACRSSLQKLLVLFVVGDDVEESIADNFLGSWQLYNSLSVAFWQFGGILELFDHTFMLLGKSTHIDLQQVDLLQSIAFKYLLYMFICEYLRPQGHIKHLNHGSDVAFGNVF